MTISHTLLTIPLFAALCLGLSGCGKSKKNAGPPKAPPTHEELAGEVIELMNSFVGTMVDAKDVEGAKAAVSRLNDLAAQFENLAKRMNSIGPPTGEAKEKIEAMIVDNEKIIRQRAVELSQVMLSNEEIGKILQEGVEKFGDRVDRLTVLEQWSGSFNPGKASS